VLLQVFRAYPDTARPLLDYHELVMRGPSPFTVAERELIAAYVSGVNECGYCHGVHTATAEAFGIQEGHVYNDATLEVFPGTPVAVDGYLYPSDAPGWGVDLDEKLAAKFTPETGQHERWAARVRRPDGGLESP